MEKAGFGDSPPHINANNKSRLMWDRLTDINISRKKTLLVKTNYP